MWNKKFFITNIDLILILITYSLLAIFSMKYYHFILGGDGISYINTAMEYFNGDYYNAINGYWSPLYSWLAVPFLYFGHLPYDAPYILRAVSFIAGFFTIISISRLATIFKFNKLTKRALLLTSIPMVLFFSIFYDTPDVVVTFILFFYLSVIFDIKYPNTSLNGVWSGIFGGLAFLAKAFMFPFFVIHFIIFNIWHYFKNFKTKRNILKNLAIGLGVFLLISGLWIGTLSYKYGELTISTSGKYNYAMVGPEYQHHPLYFVGLVNLPNPNASSVWDDPSSIKLNSWNPLGSVKNLSFQLKIIGNNLFRTVVIFEYYCLLSLLILISALWFALKKNVEISFKSNLQYILVTIFLYLGGYCLVAVEERYLWPIIILIVFTGFYMISKTYDNKIINSNLRNVFLVLLIFSAVFSPIYELTIYPNFDDDSRYLSKFLISEYGIHGNLASNKWEKTQSLSYYLGTKFYGLPKKTNNSNELQDELELYNIDYYFVWYNSTNINLSSYKEITGGRIEFLRIYSRI